MTERYVCTLKMLQERRALSFDLGRNAAGRPQRGLLVLDDAGEVFAYQDLCRHLPVFLDASERFFSDDNQHLVCRTHGALYRIRDGMCVEGPCLGLALHALPVHLRGDELWISWPLP